jgi:hypothetical protein
MSLKFCVYSHDFVKSRRNENTSILLSMYIGTVEDLSPVGRSDVAMVNSERNFEGLQGVHIRGPAVHEM